MGSLKSDSAKLRALGAVTRHVGRYYFYKMSEDEMRQGTAIPLKYQHDHIEDAVLVYTSHECTVYLLVENPTGKRKFVKLQFKGARCVRSARTDCTPAMGIYPADPGVSYIVELTDSNWAIEAHQAYTYAGSNLQPRGKHYVVSNHDVFHEILADSFVESLIAEEGSEYEFVAPFFD